MRVDAENGLVNQARQCPSPNQDPRPTEATPELIVIHGISLPPGEFGGDAIDALFTNCLDPTERPYFAQIEGLRVSAHCLIRRDGELVQYVPFHRRAWHAGESSYAGRSRCNDFAIGIELEGSDDTPYEPIQYQILAELIEALCATYPGLTRERIAGHSDIAPGRKTDPGPAFDWAHLHNLLKP